jgi:hypothetical protein
MNPQLTKLSNNALPANPLLELFAQSPIPETQLPSELVIGASYPVVCIPFEPPLTMTACVSSSFGESTHQYVPVLGQFHLDQEIIGFSYVHIHIDYRFVQFSYNTGDWINGGIVKPAKLATYSDLLYHPLVVKHASASEVAKILESVAVRELVCLHPALEYQPAEFSRKLYNKFCYDTVPATPEAVCPHRGIRLADGHTNCAGVRTCPGHGLRWSSTGQALPPSTGAAQ